jgi:hypothetical protein
MRSGGDEGACAMCWNMRAVIWIEELLDICQAVLLTLLLKQLGVHERGKERVGGWWGTHTIQFPIVPFCLAVCLSYRARHCPLQA